MSWDRLVSVGRVLAILGFWLAAQSPLTFTSRVSLQAPAEVQMFSVVKCHQPTRLGGTGKRIAPFHSVARMVSSSRRISGRGMELVSGLESFFGVQRGALSICDASFKFARASYLVSGEPWSNVRMEQRTFGEILCLLRSAWSPRWLDVCICSDSSEKGLRVRGS